MAVTPGISKQRVRSSIQQGILFRYISVRTMIYARINRFPRSLRFVEKPFHLTFTANYEISRSKRMYQDCRRYLVVCGVSTGILFSDASCQLSGTVFFHFQLGVNAILMLYLQLTKFATNGIKTLQYACTFFPLYSWFVRWYSSSLFVLIFERQSAPMMVHKARNVLMNSVTTFSSSDPRPRPRMKCRWNASARNRDRILSRSLSPSFRLFSRSFRLPCSQSRLVSSRPRVFRLSFPISSRRVFVAEWGGRATTTELLVLRSSPDV